MKKSLTILMLSLCMWGYGQYPTINNMESVNIEIADSGLKSRNAYIFDSVSIGDSKYLFYIHGVFVKSIPIYYAPKSAPTWKQTNDSNYVDSLYSELKYYHELFNAYSEMETIFKSRGDSVNQLRAFVDMDKAFATFQKTSILLTEYFKNTK